MCENRLCGHLGHFVVGLTPSPACMLCPMGTEEEAGGVTPHRQFSHIVLHPRAHSEKDMEGQLGKYGAIFTVAPFHNTVVQHPGQRAGSVTFHLGLSCTLKLN